VFVDGKKVGHIQFPAGELDGPVMQIIEETDIV